MAVADNSPLGHNGGLDALLNGKVPQGSGGRGRPRARGSSHTRSVWFVLEQFELPERSRWRVGRGLDGLL